MDLQLSGRAALVSGGSKGIGKAVARALLDEGAQVALLARGQEALDSTATELGDGVATVRADTTDSTAVTAAVNEAARIFGRLDVVVNAAAAPSSSSPSSSSRESSLPEVESLNEADFLHQLDTKALGYLRTVRAALPHLRAAGGGRIVNISGMNARSTGSITGSVRNIAVVALTKNLADQLGALNISVTCVHPGMTRTESRQFTQAMESASVANALGRAIDAGEVADLVAFLCSPRATAVNGAVITVDGSRPGSLWA